MKTMKAKVDVENVKLEKVQPRLEVAAETTKA